ncbi:Aldo/keto reductase [Mycena amicta]|nr:Aldo/keto reductase [Mycena amicta]
MPWNDIPLNDTSGAIPSLAFGTAFIHDTVGEVDQALGLGLNHLDAAQNYGNEYEVGVGIRDSGLPREELFITTKYSGGGAEKKGIKESVKDSLTKLGTTYIDLYLIHWPHFALPDIPTAWKEFEDIHAAGLAKSIGVSNFSVQDLTVLLASAKIKPAVNQILLHPYVYAQQKPIIEFSKKHGIVIEAYSPLSPINRVPGGPLDKPVQAIASRLGVTPGDVLLAWTKAKGAVVITTSSKKERLLGYLNAGDLELTEEDITSIDEAGARGPPNQFVLKTAIARRAVLVLLGIALGVLLFGWIKGTGVWLRGGGSACAFGRE